MSASRLRSKGPIRKGQEGARRNLNSAHLPLDVRCELSQERWETWLGYVSPSHGNHLLCGCKTAVIPHNSASEPRSKQHVRSFYEMNLDSLFACRGSTTCPTSTHDDDFHGQVGWMPCLLGGEGGNGLPQWSQSPPYNHIYISRKPRPVGGELHCVIPPFPFWIQS
jgi:hypothetical protein